MSAEESPIITVTFQTVLNRNLIRITDALYERNLEGAYDGLAITVGLLKEEHRNPILDNDLAHINEELTEVKKVGGVDLYWTRQHRNRKRREVLANNLYGIFLKLMDVLHKHGYLEKKPVQPKRPSKGRMRVPEE